jgi:hypothetical protein
MSGLEDLVTRRLAARGVAEEPSVQGARGALAPQVDGGASLFHRQDVCVVGSELSRCRAQRLPAELHLVQQPVPLSAGELLIGQAVANSCVPSSL